ncbi:MAG TPA: LamG-like jellyroll fold domain-containing protein [Lacipirellulaceae bacterium]
MNRLVGVCWMLVASVCSLSNASAALVGYYRFNGNANEATGNNINLNLVGNAGFGPSVNGGLGSALSVDGDGDGAIGPNYAKITTNNMTGVAWVYAESLAGDWNSIVKNWGQGVGGQFHFGLGSAAANTLQDVANGASNVAAATDLPANQWVHTAFVLDSVALQHRVYINGQLAATAAYTGTMGPGAATGLGIGHKPNDDGSALATGPGAGPWNGRIDEVGLYNEALSDAQIQTIYQNGLAGIQLDGTSVPEPATLGGLLLGCASLVAGMRRRGS